MARSFLLCKINKNISELNLNSNTQIILTDPETNLPLTEGEPNSYIQQSSTLSLGNKKIYSYDVHHELKIKQKGIVFNQPFDYYMSPSDFKLFYDKRRKLLIINANKNIALDFIEKLSEQNTDIEFTNLKFNLHKLAAKIESIKGAWINVKKSNISTQGFYGNNVKNEPSVSQSIQRGKASYITFCYIFKDKSYYIGIKSEGGITTYSNDLNLEDNLNLIYDLYDSLLK